MKHTLEIKDLSCLDTAAETFLGMIGDHRLIAFRAAMGAGKTTFISALCRKLGVNADAVSSPTFAIVNEYRGSGSRTIFHFDFYRIENPAEALDIGLYDYLDSGCLCLMEWPGNVESLLPPETVCVDIEVNKDLSRTISWEA